MEKITKLLAILAFTLVARVSLAQDTQQMIKDWERAKNYTKHYLEAMPEKDYAFKPTPEMRSFAEHMLHFTDANYELAALAGGIKSPYPAGAATKNPDRSKATIIQEVMNGYDFVLTNIRNLKPEQFRDSVRVFDKYTMSKQTLFNKIFEHQTHHRGQTTVYFHLVGVKPPDEELF